MKIGFHVEVNSANSYYRTIKSVHETGCEAMQMFLGSPYSYSAKKFYEPLAQKYVRDNEIFLISHSPYVLNFARPSNHQAVSRYVTDLQNIEGLGGFGSVLHMGYNVLKLEEVNRVFIKNLDDVSTQISHNVTMILENMSGKGSAMCCDLDSWSIFWEEIPEDLRKRIKWCVDTAHLYGQGDYNLSMRREAMRFYQDFDNMIGWSEICCIHFNGSHANLGSKKDLHADIADEYCGNIEGKGMRHLARICNQKNTHLILETPGNNFDILWQMATIKSWL